MSQSGYAVNVGRRRSKEQAGRLLGQSCRGVDVENVSQVGKELPLEVTRPAVVGAELSL
jgi:hypothetical protein